MSCKNSILRVKLKSVSQEERLLKWKEHFKKLLGNPSETTDKPIQNIIHGQLVILLVYVLLKQIVTTTIMVYKNTWVMVHSLDRDTNFLNTITEVLQKDTLVPYLFILCLDYILWKCIGLIKENGFTLKSQ